MALHSLYTEALKSVDPMRGFELLSTLARLHRVQGSEELLVAAEHVAMQLQEAGIEASLEHLQGPLGLWDHYGFWEPPGWRLLHGSVERMRSDGRWETVASTLETPLVAMAHSPPGTVAATAVHARPWLDRGQGVAVTAEPGWEGYYVLTMEQGFEAVVGFHWGPGVRYWGLHPRPGREPSAPAASIPAEAAQRIIGEKIRVSIEAEYRAPSTPVVVARLGDASGPQVVMVAHLCHPRPGAHDNASGVAVAAEALRALHALEQRLREAGVGVAAVLAPEWTGTAAAVTQSLIDPGQAVLGISLDMLAASLRATGGRLRLVTPPSPVVNILDPVLDALLAATDGENYGGAAAYEWGSDHDVLLGHSVPSSLLNEWPDSYYHTSLDTPDHISPRRLAATAASLAAAVAYMAANPHRAAEAATRLHSHLLSRTVLLGGSSSAAAELAKRAEEAAAGQAYAVARHEWPSRPAPVVERRPPYSRTYIYLHLGDRRLLRDRGLREAARRMATVAAAAGSWQAAELHHALLHGRPPSREEAEAARRLASE